MRDLASTERQGVLGERIRNPNCGRYGNRMPGRTLNLATRTKPLVDDVLSQSQAGPELSTLLARAAGGDESAWRKIVGLYARRVFALAKSRIRRPDLAEEITQSVFVTVASKLSTGVYNEQGRFEAWLFRVAMNRVRDEIRRLRRHAAPTDPEQFERSEAREQGPTQVDESASVLALPQLRVAMQELSDADREVVELRHHGGLSFNQISDMLKEPLGTVLARHHRALKKLKDLIVKQSDPAGLTEGER